MRHVWIIAAAGLVLAIIGLLIVLGRLAGEPATPVARPAATQPTTAPGDELRLGLVPEWDIFEQHRRYRGLTDYLAQKLHRPVRLVMLNNYRIILRDFAEKEVDAAFLGSFVAVLTMDDQQAKVLVKPELDGGVSTYSGVIFVPDNSPVRSLDDLGGHSIAMVRTTTAGNLFPIAAMAERHQLERAPAPKFVWVGTFDDVIRDVLEGRIEVGAVKNIRLDQYLKAHPEVRIRRLGQSADEPNMPLLVRADLASSLGPVLRQVLLGMDSDPQGKEALAKFGAQRFLPCSADEFKAVYDMIDKLGPAWQHLGITGPPPKRPAEAGRGGS